MSYSENIKRKFSKVLYLQIFVLTFNVQAAFLLCKVQTFEFFNFLPDHQQYKSQFNFKLKNTAKSELGIRIYFVLFFKTELQMF